MTVNPFVMAKSAMLPATFALSLFVVFAVSSALISTTDDENPPPSCSANRNQRSFECEVEEAKLKVSRLESILEERVREVKSKNHYFRQCEEGIEALNAQIDALKIDLSRFEHEYATASRKLSVLEEEVRLLWDASRKNNFEIHSLEFKAVDAERRLKEATSQVTEMTEIISEQWIQIQQLEQAVHMAEMRTSKFRKELWRRCPFVKFFVILYEDSLETLKSIMDPYVPRENSILGSCKNHALQTFASVKRYHHKLQGFIGNAMGRNELTAALAHEEVVFFVASALLAFPIISTCMLLLSQFS